MSRNVRRYHRIFVKTNGPGPWPCFGCSEPVTELFVHHIDEDEANDSPENLAAMHQPCHVKLHHAGKTLTDEHRRRIGEANRKSLLGKKLSAEHRRNISDGQRGWKHSPEARAKISAARTAMELARRTVR